MTKVCPDRPAHRSILIECVFVVVVVAFAEKSFLLATNEVILTNIQNICSMRK